LQSHWQLDPQIDFLNHGSFGATPCAVLREQRRFQDALERDPIQFLAPERELEPKLDGVRERIAKLVAANATDIAFVRSATDGVNAVLRSLSLAAGDEIVVTNHGYNACNNAARFVAQRAGAIVREARVPFPIAGDDEAVAAIEAQLNGRTRLLLIDHVTSPSGLLLPIDRIVELARRRDIRVLVDGSHAPGMVPVDLSRMAPDYYTANHHKWLCGPKASGFLYVRRRLQPEVRPTIISHAANRPRPGRSQFLAEFDWTGTFDPSPLLATPAAIDFLDGLHGGGLEEHMDANRQLTLKARALVLEILDLPAPAPDSMIGSMASIPLSAPPARSTQWVDTLSQRLFDRHRIEVPVFQLAGTDAWMLRFSVQAYNHLDQFQRLATALQSELQLVG
jgi:isopenicillin-N epimerase